MTRFPRSVVLFSLTVCMGAAAITRLPAMETAAGQPAFTAQEQAAQQKILDSERWKGTSEKLKHWLSVQIANDPRQLAKHEAQLERHIDSILKHLLSIQIANDPQQRAKQEAQLEGYLASMSATELNQFQDIMDRRLKILLSPEMDRARRWVDRYYTKQAQRNILDVQQPLKMTGSQLKAALDRFQEHRASVAEQAAAFNRSRQSETKALASYRGQQLAAQDKARSFQRSATFSSHYAPHVKRKQQTRYPSGWLGGWGGWGRWR